MKRIYSGDITEDLIAQSPEGEFSPARIRNGEGARYAILKGHFGWVTHVQYNPKGTLLASSSNDGLLKVWDVQTGKCIKTIFDPEKHDQGCAIFSPNGKYLASFANKLTEERLYAKTAEVKVWDMETFELVFHLGGFCGWINDIAFNHDGTHIAIAIEDHEDEWEHYKDDDAVMIWDIVHSQKIRKLKAIYEAEDRVFGEIGGKKLVLSLNINAIAYSPDGNYLAAGSNDCSLKIWEPATGKRVDTFWDDEYQIRDVVFSHHSEWVMTAGGSVLIWDVSSGDILGEFGPGIAKCLEFNQEDTRIAALYENRKKVVVWDLDVCEEICSFHSPKYYISDISFSPDGKHIAMAMENGTVRIWDLPM